VTKRFEITLLIRHTHIDPAEITPELGLQPYQSWNWQPKGDLERGNVLDPVAESFEPAERGLLGIGLGEPAADAGRRSIPAYSRISWPYLWR
jgi:hypothetical protein